MNTLDLASATWRKSSLSGGNGQCVEVAQFDDGTTAVRNSRCPDAGILFFSATEWAAFLDGVKDGEFDPVTP